MKKIRVMIVEDSAAVRQFLQQIIGGDPRLEVIAAVDSAEKALRLLEPLSPDVISMDIHLPGMDGINATQEIMQRRPTPIVVVSGSRALGSEKNPMHALRAGALAVVEKPVGIHHKDYQAIADQLCTQLAIMSQVKVIRQRFNGHRRLSVAPPSATSRGPEAFSIPGSQRSFAMLGLVASTGGPGALQTLLPSLGPDFPLPIVLVQHIMSSFHEGFVNWLNEISPMPVCTATAVERVQPGHIYVAPADRHLEVCRLTLSVRAGDAICGQRPSGTVLFQSMARTLGREAIAVLLTGMGEDGAEGLQEVRERGGHTIAEDESTAVVYGMPAAAVRRKAVCESLPLYEIGPRARRLATAMMKPAYLPTGATT